MQNRILRFLHPPSKPWSQLSLFNKVSPGAIIFRMSWELWTVPTVQCLQMFRVAFPPASICAPFKEGEEEPASVILGWSLDVEGLQPHLPSLAAPHCSYGQVGPTSKEQNGPRSRGPSLALEAILPPG